MGLFGDIGSVVGGVVGAAAGFVLTAGNPAGAVVGGVLGAELFGESEKGGPRDIYQPPVDYSEAMIAASDNNKTTALAQIMTQQMAMQQASMDRELQLSANLELSLERFDTKLQVSKLEYFQVMKAEENRHAEAMIPEPTSTGSDTV